MKRSGDVLIFVLILGCSGSPSEPDGRVVTTEIHKSGSSGIAVARNEKISTRERFTEVWSEVHSNRSPVPDVPQINFDSYDVFLAARGTTPYSCAEIEIVSVILGSSNVTVAVVKTDPALNCAPCPPATGAPVHLVRIRKPHVDAQFTTTTRTRDC